MSSFRFLLLAPFFATGCFVHLDDSRSTELFTLDEPIHEVRFDLESGDLVVRRGELAELQRTWWGPSPEMSHRVIDGVLELRVDCPALKGCRTEHVVRLPDHVEVSGFTGSGDIEVFDAKGADLTTGSGDVTARRIDEDLFVETGSGDVIVGDVGGDARILAGSGDVLAQTLYAAQARVETGSGDVQVSMADVAEGLTVLTGSGDVMIELVAGPYDLRTRTGSGDVQVDGVKIHPTSERLVDVETGSGDIHVVGR